MGKLIDSVLVTVEIDGVRYAAEVRERSAELALPVRRRGPGLRKVRALPADVE